MASGLAKAAGKASLDTAMAALAAASVGFVAFAMPDAVFADLVVASGLPSLLPAAEPPLGQSARLIFILLAAGGAFLLVRLMLRALGQQPPRADKPAPAEAVETVEAAPMAGGRRRSFVAAAEPEPEAPRIRRADAHPDAPSRRPLFAGSDLGEPLDEIDIADESEEEWLDEDQGDDGEWPEPLPGFMAQELAATHYPAAEEEELEEEAEEEAEGEPEEEPVTEAEIDAPLRQDERFSESADDEPELVYPIFPRRAEAIFVPQVEETELVRDDLAPGEEVPEWTSQTSLSEQPIKDTGEQGEQESPASQPDPVAESRPQPIARGEASISELMQRLERGLVRREQGVAAEPHRATLEQDAGHSSSASAPSPEAQAAIDDRLRNALDDLQRMASRGGQA